MTLFARATAFAAAAAVGLASAGHSSEPLTQARGSVAAPPGASVPVIAVETSRGMFTIDTFPRDAPLTVQHVIALVKAGFYDGQRVHRALPGFVVQFGDPQSRSLALRDLWGRGAAAGNGHPVGVAELSGHRRHVRGAVSLAHQGVPARAESQVFITLADRPDLDGRYAVFGVVSSNPDLPQQLQVGDEIVRVSVRE